ncbi:MAG TPA: DoxX family protein [Flavisolibacter sp.]|jgi:putative oxidoreductase|nr:DoxX family protein [Flavisolibacter sp.]
MRKLFSTKLSETTVGVALFVLRVGIASLMMIQHGLGKLQTFSKKSATWPDPFGVGHPTSLSLTIFAEFFCAAFIILGLFTRLAAVPLVIAMGVALFMVHKGRFFGEGENAGIYLICFIVILLAGPGRFSLDRFIGK